MVRKLLRLPGRPAVLYVQLFEPNLPFPTIEDSQEVKGSGIACNTLAQTPQNDAFVGAGRPEILRAAQPFLTRRDV